MQRVLLALFALAAPFVVVAPVSADHECNGDYESCVAEAEDAHSRCVSACSVDTRGCLTLCREELDLTLAQCSDDCGPHQAQIATQGCGLSCTQGGIQCEIRAKTTATICRDTCVDSYLADVRSCPPPPRGVVFGSRYAACVSQAQSLRGACDDGCDDDRSDSIAICTEVEEVCKTVYCAEIAFPPPELGEYGTLSNFSLRRESHLGCSRFYPGMFPEDCIIAGSGDRNPFLTTAGQEFIDVPGMATKFLARYEGTIAAVHFSGINVKSASGGGIDARSPIIVRALVDGQEIHPGPVSLARSSLVGGGAFTFISDELEEGIHTAQIQWKVQDDPLYEEDPIGLLRTGTIMVRTGKRSNPEAEEEPTLTTAHVTPAMPDVMLGAIETTGAWEPIYEDDGVTPLAVDFLSALDATVAIHFSAEVNASYFGALDVRARLTNGFLAEDVVMMGQAMPIPNTNPLPLSPQGFASRSWTFVVPLQAPGFDTVEFDWRYRFEEGILPGPADGIQSVAMNKRTVAVVSASSFVNEHSWIEIAQPAAPASEIDATTDWLVIPDLQRAITVPENAQVAVRFNGEIRGSNLVHLRLLVDGQPIPDSEVRLGQTWDARGALTHTYELKHLPAGTYDVAVEWKVSGTDSAATITRRNLVLSIEELPVPDLGDGPDVAAGAGQGTSVEHPIEPLTGQKPVIIVVVDPQRPQVDEITISGTPDGLYRINLNGEFHDFTASGNTATQIRDGLISAVNAGAQPVSAVPWTSNNGMALAALRVIADDLGANEFTTTVTSPDGNSLNRCPSGASCHRAPIPDISAIEDMAFGNSQSAAHFWEVMSDGRLDLVPAGPGVIGPYSPDFLGVDAIDHYWLGNHSCDGSSIDEVYNNGHAERFAVGLMAAAESGDFDFSEYDANGDGLLQERELVIVVATPQSSNGGSQFSTNLRPFCDEDEPVVLNDVIMRGFISWYTGNGTSVADPVVLAHELGHFPVDLDDMYTSSTANFPVVSDHDPARKSIMSVSDSSSWQHLDGFQKLSLGWVTPRIIRENGVYPLEDVKTGREVLILPREGSLGREYFLIENRQEEPLGDDGYDQTIGDSGIAVWWVVEPTYAGVGGCLSDTPDPNDCAPMRPGLCSYPPPTFMYQDVSQNYIRRVLRLIRPFVAVPMLGMGDLWNDSHGALADAPPICPPLMNPLGSLRWSDGTASGYGIAPLPAPTNVMNLPIFVP